MRITSTCLSVFAIVATLIPQTSPAQSLSLDQLLQQVIDGYPSVRTAAIAVETALQESRKNENLVAGNWYAQGGITRDVSLFGTETDRIQVGGGWSRQGASGNEMGWSVSLGREEAGTAFPQLPNPMLTTSVELNYRYRLRQGAGFPAYQFGKSSAQAGTIIANANRDALFDQLAGQVIELFMAAATTQSRMENIGQAISRSQRLQRYIRSRTNLGVSEQKDLLQVAAQLSSLQAEYQALEVIRNRQHVAINQLSLQPADKPLQPAYIRKPTPPAAADKLLNMAKEHSPALRVLQQRIKLAEALIDLKRDGRKNKWDLVLYVGNKTNSGDVNNGVQIVEQEESVVVGGVRLEFGRRAKTGPDAEIYQAQLDKQSALSRKTQLLLELEYRLAGLLAEIKAGGKTLQARKLSVKSEQAKLNEARRRHRVGRADTDQVILFEAQLAAAELALELQQVAQSRLYRELSLLTGELWKKVKRPNPEIVSENQQP